MPGKDTRLTFRLRSELKKKLEVVAAAEGRSVAQICEALLQAGLVGYGKEGAKLMIQFATDKDCTPEEAGIYDG